MGSTRKRFRQKVKKGGWGLFSSENQKPYFSAKGNKYTKCYDFLKEKGYTITTPPPSPSYEKNVPAKLGKFEQCEKMLIENGYRIKTKYERPGTFLSFEKPLPIEYDITFPYPKTPEGFSEFSPEYKAKLDEEIAGKTNAKGHIEFGGGKKTRRRRKQRKRTSRKRF